MKKFKISVALLAIVFAVASAFTSKSSNRLVSGYFANKDHLTGTEQALPVPAGNHSEANIAGEVATAGSFEDWILVHCDDPTNITCAIEVQNNVIVHREMGTYKP